MVQRVTRASVTIDGAIVGEIGPGLLVFVAVAREDQETDTAYIADKLVNLRIFSDAEGRFDLSALDTRADLLVVSQFTLYADTRKGRRPSFVRAATPALARGVFEGFLARLHETGLRVATGRFQEAMQVDLRNDGPVTIMLDSADRSLPRRAKPPQYPAARSSAQAL